MKPSNFKLLLITSLVMVLFNGCNKNGPVKPGDIAKPGDEVKKTAPTRLPVTTEQEATFYPTYGYREGTNWNIHLRGWVHKNRKHLNEFLTRLAEVKGKCRDVGMSNFQARSDDFEDDDKTFEKVVIKFDSDPEDKEYVFSRKIKEFIFKREIEVNGVIEMDLVLSDEKAKQLLDKQGSSNGWLTFRAVSREHTGLGRIKLIEPEGDSLVSDIDDTIKVTEILAGQETVVKNTFCHEFKPAPDMAKMYTDLGDIPVHYVSGGPQQLFGPLYDYLITGAGGFPEGTFHLKFFPKNLLSGETRSNLKRFIASSLDVTYDHKIAEITALMDKFKGRKFILIGDSGEVDPEVYSQIKRDRGEQVKGIWIRDVINDAPPSPNSYRLAEMNVIKADLPACIDEDHFKKLSAKINKLYLDHQYQRTVPLCVR